MFPSDDAGEIALLHDQGQRLGPLVGGQRSNEQRQGQTRRPIAEALADARAGTSVRRRSALDPALPTTGEHHVVRGAGD
jgi:hypothetical protein